MNSSNKLTRIAVIYDGNYFLHVNNYYAFYHKRKAKISIKGLHDFIRHKVAEVEEDSSGYRHCQIVDAHYFRGRLNAYEASKKSNTLFYERLFDDILMYEGVTTHYMPLKVSSSGEIQERGIDVWLALEAFELSSRKNFDVLVLIASDGDYTPLIRKLNALGTRVMLLSWDFEYSDNYGRKRITRTSQELLEVVTYPIAMHEEIDKRVSKSSFQINNLFLQQQKPEPKPVITTTDANEAEEEFLDIDGNSIEFSGEVLSIHNGYGFIKREPNNIFFHHQSVIGLEFEDLMPGTLVNYKITKNPAGEDIAIDVEMQGG